MKKIFLLTVCLLIVSFTSFAGKLVMIPVSEMQRLETLFADKDLKIHYYCDDYVLATAEVLSYDNAVVLDEHAFTEVDHYAIVYCYNDYKEEYLAKIAGSVETLYSGEHFFIMKLIGDGFMPAKNDGMVVIRDREAKLIKSTFDYPVVTEPDETILNLISQVSTDSLIAVVQHLQDYVTRDCQHTNIVNVRNWLKSKYDNLDLEVTFHNFPYYNNSNVIAIQYGTELPDEYIVCGAHYDSKTWYPPNPEVAPGADDNATGTAGIMEIAKILSQYDFKRSIIYCAFSGEEYGLYGSDYYAQQCANQGMDILGYFNIDMSGYLNPNASNITISIIRPAMAAPLDTYYTNVANIYFPQVNITHHTSMSGDSDHSSFCTYGYQGIYPFENNSSYSPYIHTPNDIIGISVNNQEQVRVFTQVSLACIATLAVFDGEMPPPLNPPTNCVTEYLQDMNISITWDAPQVTTPDGYSLYRDGVKISENITETFYTDIVEDFEEHCYTVTAIYENTESQKSNKSCITVPMAVPTNCVAEYVEDMNISISWDAPANITPNGYYVYRDNDKITQDVWETTIYTDILEDYFEHCYKITAIYGTYESEFSNESCDSVPFIDNIREYNSLFKIYPNPANNELRIEIVGQARNDVKIEKVEIFDIYGRNLISYLTPPTTLDISHLTSGVYFIKISDEFVGKFVKQ